MDSKSYDFADKVVLITGGTGSFGQHMARRLLRTTSARKVIIFSRDEQKQFEMAQREEFRDPRMRFFIGDVRDVDRLNLAMREAQVVLHAAAMKHVTIAEYNPFECIHTNVLGAENVVRAALYCGVEKVIALSTDKACNPTNLYGASKLASDKIFVAANNLSGSFKDTRFSVVRYGNVVGSRGSVVPFFLRLLKEGATKLPITDARMTRFCITLSQGVEFVVSALAMMRGGEVFVPKIPSIKIVDLARALAPNLEIDFVGIRPGEKLHEMMISADDSRYTFELEDRYVMEPSVPIWTGAGQGIPWNKRVEDGFEYASNTNDEWLLADDINALVDDFLESKA